ncbi:MAG: hypothetical protein GY696_19855 [Gammaproteobacteria bacterium]|nr:hypothetical protein [Gammaproteobacteria bacterium]
MVTENKIVLLELRIMVRDEHFLVYHGNIESQTEHLQLPCTVKEGGCQTSRKTQLGTATYIEYGQSPPTRPKAHG